jgi:hypothetical protein
MRKLLVAGLVLAAVLLPSAGVALAKSPSAGVALARSEVLIEFDDGDCVTRVVRTDNGTLVVEKVCVSDPLPL